ncbi:MAG: HAMP domain-containing histidine kinase, partial [Gemmatimonadales bacterium]
MDAGSQEHRVLERPTALPATEVLIGRIGWLIRLRWIAIAGVLAFVEIARHGLDIQVFVSRIYFVLGILALYNLTAFLVLRHVRRTGTAGAREIFAKEARQPIGALARFLLPRTPPGVDYYDRQAARAAVFANVQIGLDLVLLAALLHFAGGIENPLRVFFVFHVIIASLLLSRRATYAHATLGVLLLSAVALGESRGILPHYSLQSHWRADGYLDPRLVGTQIFLLGVTLYVAAYLASSIVARLRRREVDVVVLSQHLAVKAKHVEAAYAELSAAEKAKSQYMRKVAHELREPLGTIKTALSVVLESAPGTMATQVQDLIRRAHQRAGELADVTQELLSLSRARGSKAAVEHTTVDPGDVARKVLDEMQPRAEDKGVVLTTEIEGTLEAMQGDPEGLADLMGNLLSNAIRYTPEDGTVTFRMHAVEGTLVIEVVDTGIGIPEEDLPRIYEEFFRSTAAREFAPVGSGLGMAIVQAVVEQHEGSISVESAGGHGTRVQVDAAVGLLRNGAAHHIADRQRGVSLAPHFPQSRERIGRLATLGDAEHQCVRLQRRVAVAEFAGVFNFHRQAGQILQQVLANQSRMP